MKRYLEIYNIIKSQIENKELSSGSKIPSVRKAAELYGVSITTIQNAYFELCADGYIIAQDKSGYYVTAIAEHTKEDDSALPESKYKYNLTGGAADKDSFDLTLWQRYIKSALRQESRMLSYSDVQGEYDLRCAISEYIKEKRNVVASPERIIIGAGMSSMLSILCAILDRKSVVSFPDKSFEMGIEMFSDYGYDVRTRYKDADVIYVSPSHMTRWGDVMTIKRRLELAEYSNIHNSIVIEDDYENEFLYSVRPTPSLYALGNGNVVYICSFSAMLLPAIRISFMVLTPNLYEVYKSKIKMFAQTASKTEQIALCNYIRDGHIKSQTRRVRRLYTAKAKDFAAILSKKIPNAKIEIGDNNLQLIITAPFYKDTDSFEKAGLLVNIENLKDNVITIVCSPAGIPYDELENAADLIKSAIE